MKNTKRPDRDPIILLLAVLSTIIALVILTITEADANPKERDYQNEWCKHEIEYILPDKTRVDCLTPYYAIEFDYARKWAEAIGQSIHYGLQTNRRAGIVLILEKESDIKYWKRLQDIIWNYKLPVQTWMLKAYE